MRMRVLAIHLGFERMAMDGSLTRNRYPCLIEDLARVSNGISSTAFTWGSEALARVAVLVRERTGSSGFASAADRSKTVFSCSTCKSDCSERVFEFSPTRVPCGTGHQSGTGDDCAHRCGRQGQMRTTSDDIERGPAINSFSNISPKHNNALNLNWRSAW